MKKVGVYESLENIPNAHFERCKTSQQQKDNCTTSTTDGYDVYVKYWKLTGFSNEPKIPISAECIEE